MAVTTLDTRSALVLIDLQTGIVALLTVHSATTVVAEASRLAQAFREHELPVILVTVEGMPSGRTERPMSTGELPPAWSDLAADLDTRPGDHLITKYGWGAFETTELEQHLREFGVTQIVLAGISTSVGVESTARAAHERGFNVTVAIDAVTDTDLDAHVNSIQRIFPALGETGTTDAIIELLADRMVAK